MIKDYRENLLTDVMSKIGFADLFNKNTPVVIKQDFVVDEYSLIKAGTVGYIKKANTYDVKYKKEYSVCRLTLSTPKHGDISLFCKVSDKTDSVKVSGLKDAIEFKELLEIADEKTGRTIERYCTLREDYENTSWSYHKKSDVVVFICAAFATIMFLVGITSWVAFANMILGITTIALAVILAVVGVVVNNRGFNDTAKGKTLNSKIEDVVEEISKKDEELCKKFAD